MRSPVVGGAKGGRLADVVEQHTPGERWGSAGGKTFEHQEGVNPDVAFGMILRRLLDAFHGGDFGKEFDEQAGLVEKFKAAAGGAFGEQFGEFVANAFRGDGMNLRERCVWMAAKVAGSMGKSKRAAKRMARSMRNLSSVKRRAGSPMARMSRWRDRPDRRRSRELRRCRGASAVR